MTRVGDAELEAQLSRRAGGQASAERQADSVRLSVSGTSQERPSRWNPAARAPWDRPRLAPLRGVAMVVAAVVVAVVVVAPRGGTEPAASPGPTPHTGWYLSTSDLVAVVRAASEDPSLLGKIVVADVSLTSTQSGDCAAPQGGACVGTVITEVAGTAPPIRVAGFPSPPICSPGLRCAIPAPPGGAMALRIESGSVDFVAMVEQRAASPGEPWPMALAISHLAGPAADSSNAIVVDAWLSSVGGPLPCPYQIGIRPSDLFGCGNAVWLTATPYEPVRRMPDGSVAFGSPPDAIRVQNDAYLGFTSGSPTEEPSGSLPPQHGLYLVQPRAVDPEACFSCSSATGYLLARVDTVEVPTGESTPPSPTATPAVAPSPEGTLTGLAVLGPDELVALVRQAQLDGTGVGRTVVADVSFEARGDCSGAADSPAGATAVPAACFTSLQGSDPPIRLLGATTSSLCPTGWFCTMQPWPAVPVDGPFALRIRGDGALDWVGWVATGPGGHSEWTFQDLRTRLAGATGDQLDDYRLYVVSGWVSGAAFDPRCPPIPSEDVRFGCGQVAWLTEADVQPNALPTDGWSLTTPAGSIRLQNGAYLEFAPDPTSPNPTTLPQTRYGTFLVQPAVPVPSCLFCDGPAAELVARLDPP